MHQENKKYLSIIIPVFNEKRFLEKLFKDLIKYFDKQQDKLRIRMIKRQRIAVMMETRQFVSLQHPNEPRIILTVEAGVCRWYDFKYDNQMYTPWISCAVTCWRRCDDQSSYLKWKEEHTQSTQMPPTK